MLDNESFFPVTIFRFYPNLDSSPHISLFKYHFDIIEVNFIRRISTNTKRLKKKKKKDKHEKMKISHFW